MTSPLNEADAPPVPLVRIERGEATAEELAALLAVLGVRLAAGARREPRLVRAPARWYRAQPTPFEPRAWRSGSLRGAA